MGCIYPTLARHVQNMWIPIHYVFQDSNNYRIRVNKNQSNLDILRVRETETDRRRWISLSFAFHRCITRTIPTYPWVCLVMHLALATERAIRHTLEVVEPGRYRDGYDTDGGGARKGNLKRRVVCCGIRGVGGGVHACSGLSCLNIDLLEALGRITPFPRDLL